VHHHCPWWIVCKRGLRQGDGDPCVLLVAEGAMWTQPANIQRNSEYYYWITVSYQFTSANEILNFTPSATKKR